MIVRVKKHRAENPTVHSELPSYGELWRHPESGTVAVILGNSIRDDHRIWAADNDTGEMAWPQVTELVPAVDLSPQPLAVTAAKCVNWARDGNADAMWWLGHFYEYGSEDVAPCGEKALAYYMAAMRRDRAYTHNFVRIYTDGRHLFMTPPDEDGELGCGPAKFYNLEFENQMTPDDVTRARAFTRQFTEFVQADAGQQTVKPGDWREAVAIAESVS